MYKRLLSNEFGAWNPATMPPKRCEQVDCDALATVVAVANHANWYLCDLCAGEQGVEIAVRLTPHPPDAASLPTDDDPGESRGAGEASR